MSSVRDLTEDARVDKLVSVVKHSGTKFVCFTNVSNDGHWIIAATDGCDLWRIEMDDDALEAHRDAHEVTTLDAFLARVRSSFISGDIQVTQRENKLNLQVGLGKKVLEFDLFEPKALEKKTEMSTLLFRLAETSTELESKYEKAQEKIATLQQHKAPGMAGMMFDGEKKKKGAPKAPPKAAGMSAFNPASRKRKAATGVQFD